MGTTAREAIVCIIICRMQAAQQGVECMQLSKDASQIVVLVAA